VALATAAIDEAFAEVEREGDDGKMAKMKEPNKEAAGVPAPA
jgi:hypothetical protein